MGRKIFISKRKKKKNKRQKVFYEKYLLSIENFNTHLDLKRNRSKTEKILGFGQKA